METNSKFDFDKFLKERDILQYKAWLLKYNDYLQNKYFHRESSFVEYTFEVWTLGIYRKTIFLD